MHLYMVIFLVLAANRVILGTDPSACQRAIKYMLIRACGTTKRESSLLPQYKVMSKEEIDKQYSKMVKENMIKGVYLNDINDQGYSFNDLEDIDNDEGSTDKLYFPRNKRKVFELGMRRKDKNFAEATAHERVGSFHFVGRSIPERDEDRSPPPGALKAKCCGGPYFCTPEDFKGYCG